MPTQQYVNSKGERIPGNTTIIGSNLGWNKQALIYWGWSQGKAGLDFRQTRDAAADAGTLAHAMIESWIKGQPFDKEKYAKELIDIAETGFLNYLEWADQVHFEPITMEVPLISEKYQFGTTIDILAKVSGKLSIVECKTSNDIYEDFLIQMSAQRVAWDENHPDELIQALHLLRVNKEHASFTHSYYDALPGAFEAFLDLRDLHDRKKQLKKLL
jgi:hypothetical protein